MAAALHEEEPVATSNLKSPVVSQRDGSVTGIDFAKQVAKSADDAEGPEGVQHEGGGVNANQSDSTIITFRPTRIIMSREITTQSQTELSGTMIDNATDVTTKPESQSSERVSCVTISANRTSVIKTSTIDGATIDDTETRGSEHPHPHLNNDSIDISASGSQKPAALLETDHDGTSIQNAVHNSARNKRASDSKPEGEVEMQSRDVADDNSATDGHLTLEPRALLEKVQTAYGEDETHHDDFSGSNAAAVRPTHAPHPRPSEDQDTGKDIQRAKNNARVSYLPIPVKLKANRHRIDAEITQSDKLVTQSGAEGPIPAENPSKPKTVEREPTAGGNSDADTRDGRETARGDAKSGTVNAVKPTSEVAAEEPVAPVEAAKEEGGEGDGEGVQSDA